MSWFNFKCKMNRNYYSYINIDENYVRTYSGSTVSLMSDDINLSNGEYDV